ncbi:hypothetical protein [Luteibacter rhizovicinus]|uniref:hypothetical protein n=1 Tax=Luteibacter rhizovicinus TaxID=242606 RepID=UPI0010453520|nr:hypothetical protein [Luteibacter rhizovicinus]
MSRWTRQGAHRSVVMKSSDTHPFRRPGGIARPDSNFTVVTVLPSLSGYVERSATWKPAAAYALS